MVLYKRKPVSFLSSPQIPQDTSIQVYYIPQTKEWFINYEDYLNRMDYFKRKKFVCEITGNSCLTFFEALESEAKEIEGVERNFPEALREHILRFLQFNRITRLDQLVDKVYSVFKNDFFPGETIFIKGSLTDYNSLKKNITITNDSHKNQPLIKQRGVVREKVQQRLGDSITTKYLVVRLNDMQQSIVTPDKIARDRNHFTKWLIKTFIKLTMARSHKVNAPWVVKDKFAKKYRIPQVYPEDLIQYADSTPSGENIIKDHPNNSRIKNGKNGHSYVFQQETGDEDKKIRKKPGPKAEQQKLQQQQILLKKKFPAHYLPENLELDDDLFISERSTPTVNGGTAITTTTSNVINSSSLQPTKKHITNDLEIKFDIQNPKPSPQALLLPENAKSWNKHLIQELTNEINNKEEENSNEEEEDVKPNRKITTKLGNDDEFDINNFTPEALNDLKILSSPKVSAVQEALQSWIFINVYHSALNLDTFTFDDFIYAMGWNSDQFNELGRCELLDEIWCSILSAFMSNQLPTGKELAAAKEKDTIFGLQIHLPPKDSFITPNTAKKELDGEGDDDDERGSESEHEEKTLKSEDDEEEDDDDEEDTVTVKKSSKSRSKSSNGTKKEETIDVDDEDADGEDEEEEEEENEDNEENNEDEDEDMEQADDVDHNAYIVMNHRNSSWDDRLRKRNFKDGNWQCILLGLLSQVEYVPTYQPIIEKLYHVLAPKDLPATPSTVLNQFYEKVDINLKFKVLKLLVDLLISGTKVRSYIDECLDASTNLRRNRLDNIRDYKISLENAQRVNAIMVDMLHEHNKSTDEVAVSTPTPAPVPAAENGSATTATTTTSNSNTINRRPRLNYQAFEMTEIEKAFSEQNTTFKELWHERTDSLLKLKQLKLDKREIEKKLTELDCQRVKLLGKDRLFNRYWWFENNGLPTLHGGTNDEDENEEETKEKEVDDTNDDDGKDEVLEETYLMGKLWIQGPSDDDLRIYFKTNYEDSDQFNQDFSNFEFEEFLKHLNKQAEEKIDEKKSDVKQEPTVDGDSSNSPPKERKTQIKHMDFTKLPVPFTKTVSKLYDLNFTSNQILKGDEVIIDHEGALISYEKSQILTPFQRKSIEEYSDPLINGSNWRFYDKPDQISKLISWLNPWGKRESQLKKELALVKDAIVSSIEARRKALWLDKTPEEEVNIENDIEKIVQKIKSIENGGDEEEAEAEIEDDDDISPGPKRNLRRKFTPRKKQKINSVNDVVEFGDISQLQEFASKLHQQLKEKREERDLSRVLEWVNSKALESFDKSLYDGGDKWKSKHSKRTKR
ncbi:hypothetical protein DFJ63DRAFT_302555 [Scheffersomyces coipomensis]|uniref:uncharacterized protein n=1 Tax=Scheffersomyces coipomensis TaxID=1788519 RepID=UPI00315C8B75